MSNFKIKTIIESFKMNDDNDNYVVIPDEVTCIEQGIFNFSKVKTLVLGKGVRSIEANAFNSMYHLETIIFNEGLETIPEGCCCLCSNLKEVRLPQSLKSIGNGAFAYSSNVNLTIPKCIETIHGDFIYCNTSIKSLEIPETVKYLSDLVFHRTSIETIIFDNPSIDITVDLFKIDSLKTVVFNVSDTSVIINKTKETIVLLRMDTDIKVILNKKES